MATTEICAWFDDASGVGALWVVSKMVDGDEVECLTPHGLYNREEAVAEAIFRAKQLGVRAYSQDRITGAEATEWEPESEEDTERDASDSEAVCKTIRKSLDFCKEQARVSCHDHSSDWTPTEADCDAVVVAVKKKYGRMPTRSEWSDAAPELKWVGNKHYEG